MKNKNDFEFKYVAPTSEERKEIESIRSNYITQTKSMDKITYLRRLNSRVKNIPAIVSLIVGVLGALIFGLGMTMVLEWSHVVWGVIVGAIGVIPMLISYPIYVRLINNLKSKYAEEIIKISDELLSDEK